MIPDDLAAWTKAVVPVGACIGATITALLGWYKSTLEVTKMKRELEQLTSRPEKELIAHPTPAEIKRFTKTWLSSGGRVSGLFIALAFVGAISSIASVYTASELLAALNEVQDLNAENSTLRSRIKDLEGLPQAKTDSQPASQSTRDAPQIQSTPYISTLGDHASNRTNDNYGMPSIIGGWLDESSRILRVAGEFNSALINDLLVPIPDQLFAPSLKELADYEQLAQDVGLYRRLKVASTSSIEAGSRVEGNIRFVANFEVKGTYELPNRSDARLHVFLYLNDNYWIVGYIIIYDFNGDLVKRGETPQD